MSKRSGIISTASISPTREKMKSPVLPLKTSFPEKQLNAETKQGLKYLISGIFPYGKATLTESGPWD